MYPIYNINYNKCLNCGAKDSVYPCDSRGYQSSDLMIYSVTHMKCKICGKEFIIKWIPNPNKEGEMIPVCTDKENLDMIVNDIIDYSIQLKREDSTNLP